MPRTPQGLWEHIHAHACVGALVGKLVAMRASQSQQGVSDTRHGIPHMACLGRYVGLEVVRVQMLYCTCDKFHFACRSQLHVCLAVCRLHSLTLAWCGTVPWWHHFKLQVVCGHSLKLYELEVRKVPS